MRYVVPIDSSTAGGAGPVTGKTAIGGWSAELSGRLGSSHYIDKASVGVNRSGFNNMPIGENILNRCSYSGLFVNIW